jgi:hypothetical protein
MKKLALSLIAASAAALASSSGFTILQGSVVEFDSPDDLLLDAATNVIAANVVSTADQLVNGVNFQSDGAAAFTSSASNGGVTVTTARTAAGGELPTWAVAPAFTGGSPGSAANLGSIMRSIRWSQGRDVNGDTGNQLTIDITGLNDGALYDVQLLFNEGGAAADRRFDIGVDGTLVVDDFSSQGGNGTYTASNSFAYQGIFGPGADGALNIVLDDDLGGDPFSGTDGNPILQGVIVHLVVPEPASGALFGLGAIGLALRRRRR